MQHTINEIRNEASWAICESHAGTQYNSFVKRIARRFHPVELATAWEFFKDRSLPMKPGYDLTLEIAKENTKIAKVIKKALRAIARATA